MNAPLKSSSLNKLGQLSTLKLPSLPPGTPYLLESLTNENIDFVELASIIEKFPSIAAKLISLVNSVWSAPVSEVTSLEATCSRLGFGVVRSTSIALAISAPFDPTKCASFEPDYFWCSAFLTAEAAFRLASVSSAKNVPEPSTARAAGLLHNLGLLWLVDKIPDEVGQAFELVKNHQAESLQQALLSILEFDQAQAGGFLARSWELPEPLEAAMTHFLKTSYRGSQQEIITTVGLAFSLVSTIMKEEVCPHLDPRVTQLGITTEIFTGVFEQISLELEKTRAIAKVLIR
jgi:HD-like signal output (HDOD) protein